MDASKPEIILTAQVGLNSDLIASAAAVYLKPEMTVADITFGRGVFWKKVDTEQFTFLPSDLATGTDCRDLPYEDASCDAVIFDPPYIYNPKDTIKESISGQYNVNTTGLGLTTINAVVAFYHAGMDEASRVLKPGGLMFVKCQDQIESGKQRWVHIELFDYAKAQSLLVEDLLVLVQLTQPTIRWPHQKHARKNHSYLWIFKKRSTRRKEPA